MQEIFIRAVFGKRRSLGGGEEALPHPEPQQSEPVRIIHKEQDFIAAFSLNQVNIIRTNIKMQLKIFFFEGE